MLKEGSEEVRKNKCADAEGQPQQQPLQTDSNSNSKRLLFTTINYHDHTRISEL